MRRENPKCGAVADSAARCQHRQGFLSGQVIRYLEMIDRMSAMSSLLEMEGAILVGSLGSFRPNMAPHYGPTVPTSAGVHRCVIQVSHQNQLEETDRTLIKDGSLTLPGKPKFYPFPVPTFMVEL